MKSFSNSYKDGYLEYSLPESSLHNICKFGSFKEVGELKVSLQDLFHIIPTILCRIDSYAVDAWSIPLLESCDCSVYCHCRLPLPWVIVTCWYIFLFGHKNCLYGQGLSPQPEILALSNSAFLQGLLGPFGIKVDWKIIIVLRFRIFTF